MLWTPTDTGQGQSCRAAPGCESPHQLSTFSRFPSTSFAAPVLLMRRDRQPLPHPFLLQPPTEVILHIGKTQQFLFFFIKSHTLKNIYRKSNLMNKQAQAGRFCISATLLLAHPSVSLESSKPEEDLPPAPVCRGSKCSWSRQGGRKRENPSPRGRTAFVEDSDPQERQTATQLLPTRNEWRLGKQPHTKCLDVPRRQGCCLPSTKLCFFVSWTTKKHLCASQSQTPPKIQRLLYHKYREHFCLRKSDQSTQSC